MTNQRKVVSDVKGKLFLQDAFAIEQQVLQVQLELSAKSIVHDGTMGTVNESHFIQVLRSYLPKRYKIDTGIAIDSRGKTSDQIDVIIYDNQYTPVLLDQKAHRYIPAEAIYAVFESKPTINKRYLNYAANKAASVRALHRTTVEIPHAGGTYPAKSLFPIIAGIIASRIDWEDGFGVAFYRNYKKLVGDRELNCGLAVMGHCFDKFNDNGKLTYGPPKQALIFFLFRFLQKLQSLGTVPAIDWNSYARILSE